MEAQAHETAPPRKLSLMELVEVYQAIFAEADAADGEVTPEMSARFDAVNADIALKAEAIAYVVRDRRAKAAASKALGKPYVDRGSRLDKQADALERRLYEAMKATDRKKIETLTATIAIEANGGKPSLVITGAVPAEYLKPGEPDNTKIREALADNKTLDFAKLERGEHLRIR